MTNVMGVAQLENVEPRSSHISCSTLHVHESFRRPFRAPARQDAPGLESGKVHQRRAKPSSGTGLTRNASHMHHRPPACCGTAQNDGFMLTNSWM